MFTSGLGFFWEERYFFPSNGFLSGRKPSFVLEEIRKKLPRDTVT